ncbi:hypothetical protein BDV93DRAFT_611205 [Ceratobasidium sp. AG-I]|nr:hypothetical protein BDV93DRAFT_611205 [Ceratobasidium sp. AG-I]
MSGLPDGSYHIFSTVGDFRLAWYEGDSVKANDSSNVLVEIKTVYGGYQLRYNNQGTKSPWFGASDNLSDDDRVLLNNDTGFVWSITAAGSGLYKIAIFNKNAVWYLRDGFTSGSSVQLAEAEGRGSELWNLQPE